jgi:CubicO group peptidase (beta-lactamase class C family)
MLTCSCFGQDLPTAKPEEVVEKLAVLPLLFDPGEGWEYGHSTDVLGRVVEVVSGVTLDRFIRNEICSPLGMNDTFFILPNEKR